MRENKFNIYSRGEDGHRSDYIAFFETELMARRRTMRTGLVSRDPLLFLMVEEAFFQYFLISLIRSFFGRKTAGLVFRPLPCLAKATPKLHLKYCLLRVLKVLPRSESISIVPFCVLPNIKEICNARIFDIQFWDLSFLLANKDREKIETLKAELRQQANGRKILSLIGKQDELKGFELVAKSYLASEDFRGKYLMVSGGVVSGTSTELIEQLTASGAVIMNHRISDEELIALYEAGDVVWACYAPEYDQSSGVLGRALQFGKPVIVREGSVAEKICIEEEHPYCAVQYVMPSNDSILLQLDNLPTRFKNTSIQSAIGKHRKTSTALLDRLLGSSNG